MAPPNGHLDVPKIEPEILDLNHLATKPGFFGGLSNVHRPPTYNLLYIHPPFHPLLCYLYHISILPLYTLVGWTDSQNKLKTSDLACPPTQNLHWTLVGQIILPWTKSKILPLHFSSTQYQAICSLDNLSSSRIRAKMAKIGTIQRARKARSKPSISKAIISNSRPKFPISYQGKTENQKTRAASPFIMRDPTSGRYFIA